MPRVNSMPPSAYNRVVSYIRDYPRLVCELEQMRRDVECLKTASYNGMPKGAGGSGLDDKIAELVDLEKEVQKIQALINTIPEDLRDGIMRNIMYNVGYPRNEYKQLVPSLRTWQRAKERFLLRFAKEMSIYGKYAK